MHFDERHAVFLETAQDQPLSLIGQRGGADQGVVLPLGGLFVIPRDGESRVDHRDEVAGVHVDHRLGVAPAEFVAQLHGLVQAFLRDELSDEQMLSLR